MAAKAFRVGQAVIYLPTGQRGDITAFREDPDRQPWQPLMGISEEVGELVEALLGTMPVLTIVKALGRLSHAHLKQAWGIRGTAEQHEAAAKDAIGDIIIFLTDYCTARGFDLQEIIESTWNRVRRRDWQQDPEKGGELA